ncbi:MAG: S-layer homology domain-containing protein [Chloroflexota bacterium]|nr:S-layer homology domain-containing protein [Chloroflexota bacterium]MDQ5867203.1 S-layer homology domain-containing protein [Chloroflexota bacterium]
MITLTGVTTAHRKPIAVLVACMLALAFVGFYGPVAADPVTPKAPEGGTCPSGQCFQDVPAGSPFFDYANNLYLDGIISGYACGGPGEPCGPPENRPYYRPGSDVTRAQMTKFVDLARKLPGIHIATSSHVQPLYSSSSSGVGVTGESTTGTGVRGYSPAGTGVQGNTISGNGVRGVSTSNGSGVSGSSHSGYAVVGSSPNGHAGFFAGKVVVQGSLDVFGNVSKGGGSFKIDHPLDPENKYLYHSFVESPDMMNVYNGNVVLDGKGEANVQLPTYFEALNHEFRYQLTALGAPGPNLYIAEKIKDNSFKIAGGQPGMEVSWQVTGIRQDPYANEHRIPVEEDKAPDERGLYLYPDAYNQPDNKQIGKVDLP